MQILRTIQIMAALTVMALLIGCSTASPADLILTNGNIYTVNKRQPRAQAVAIRGDRIVAVGAAADVMKYHGTRSRVIDLQGRTVVPGLTDSHCRLLGIGQREMTLNLELRLRRVVSCQREKTCCSRPSRVS